MIGVRFPFKPKPWHATRPRWEIVWGRIAVGVLIAAWLAAFVATHIPGPDLPNLEVSDKILHSVGYAGLAALLGIVLIFRRWPVWPRVLVVFAILSIYGACDELSQPPFQRTADINDWLFDCLGTLVSLCVLETAWWLVRMAWRKKRLQTAGLSTQETPHEDGHS